MIEITVLFALGKGNDNCRCRVVPSLTAGDKNKVFYYNMPRMRPLHNSLIRHPGENLNPESA